VHVGCPVSFRPLVAGGCPPVGRDPPAHAPLSPRVGLVSRPPPPPASPAPSQKGVGRRRRASCPFSLLCPHSEHPADRSASVLWIVSGAPFLRSSGICPNLSAPRERLPRTGTAHRKHTSGVRGLAWEAYVLCWSGFPLQSVHRFESLRLSDMSNRLFVAVFS
jgi:hypothetical protein